jgi:hypothetical protein
MAIAALRADTSATPPTDGATKDAAERRQVTIMFCDLVGSTALSACMDPEDLREIISAYQKCVAETVRRFDGEPNMVVVAESTRRLLGNLFELQHLGDRDLKGIAGRVHAWAALRPSSVDSRFEALHASDLTALVGREEESELLLRRWSKAKTGEGQVGLLAGEPGIGKSRLTATLLERLAAEPHTRPRYFCSPQHTDSALFPIIGQMQRAAGLAHDDAPGARLDKLDALLAQTSTSIEDAALIAEMLSLPNDGRYPALDLDPQQRRQKTLEALVWQLEALTRSKPVLTIFEDAHWTDPTSLELFSRTVDRLRTLRALLIVTFRPEFDPPWIGRPYVTALTINRLAEREVGAMLDRLVGNKLISASIRQDIIERTAGTRSVMAQTAGSQGSGALCWPHWRTGSKWGKNATKRVSPRLVTRGYAAAWSSSPGGSSGSSRIAPWPGGSMPARRTAVRKPARP